MLDSFYIESAVEIQLPLKIVFSSFSGTIIRNSIKAFLALHEDKWTSKPNDNPQKFRKKNPCIDPFLSLVISHMISEISVNMSSYTKCWFFFPFLFNFSRKKTSLQLHGHLFLETNFFFLSERWGYFSMQLEKSSVCPLKNVTFHFTKIGNLGYSMWKSKGLWSRAGQDINNNRQRSR